MKVSNRCILLMPERNDFIFEKEGYGICSDYIDKIHKIILLEYVL